MKHLLAVLWLLAAAPSQAIILRVNPDPLVGTTLLARLVISGLGNHVAPSISAFDLDVSFSPNVLDFRDAVFGDSDFGDQLNLSGMGSLTGFTEGVGTVNLFEISFDSPDQLDLSQAETFTLATLTFDVIGAGSSAFSIKINALGDSCGDPVYIPEPSSLPLVGLGMLAMIWLPGKLRRNIGQKPLLPHLSADGDVPAKRR